MLAKKQQKSKNTANPTPHCILGLPEAPMTSANVLTGCHWIAGVAQRSGPASVYGVDPSTQKRLEPAFCEAGAADVDLALRAAAAVHPAFELIERERRAGLLERIALSIEELGTALLERAGSETGLPRARLESERGRTCGQLRFFAQLVRQGDFLETHIEPGDPQRQPLPRPDLRRMQRAVGPVVVFGASNFPLAFSVAGGDTAAALAAGCPVVVKGHPNHPGTGELVAQAVCGALARMDLPAGIFSFLQGAEHGLGAALVTHPQTRAVAFTGSRAGGLALLRLAQARTVPIPVYAEMGSINPVFLLPGQVARQTAPLAAAIAGAVTQGVGQFCTNPGLLVLVNDGGGREFLAQLQRELERIPEAPLLHRGIQRNFQAGLEKLGALPGVEMRLRLAAEGPCHARPALLAVSAERFLAMPAAQEEVFGPSTLAVLCRDRAQMLEVARGLEGQLTASLHAADEDLDLARELLPLLSERAGRVIFGGLPTGVEVNAAMVHGGPYPASSSPRDSSIGSLALRRFLRPVCYQNLPQALLPLELRDRPVHGA
jgi:NADP-dependent aldehyde dehydrogenase